MQERTQVSRLGAALAGLAGVVIVIGSILSWAKASVTGLSVTARGIDGWEGKWTILGGVVLLVAGLSALTSLGARARLRAPAIIGGGIAAGVGIYTALTAKDRLIDDVASEIGKQLGVTFDQARASVQDVIDQGTLKISLEIGLYLVIAGGLVGIGAGLLALARRAPVPSLPAPPDAGLSGWAASAPTAPPPPASVPGEPIPDVWAMSVPPPPPPGPGPAGDGGPAEAKE
jgi:hypothetical protein